MIKLNSAIVFILCVLFSPKINSQIHPVKELGELFVDVQNQQVFQDQKKFVDCKPKFPVDTILKHYHQEKNKKQFQLNTFIAEYFDTLLLDTTDLLNHIDNLWLLLTKQADDPSISSSLIPLPNPYIVPGGRFREIYYWDSYFTMLGLKEAGKFELIEDMIDNFAYLIDQYGHIPNGNRSYYLSRSQPPFFSLMIDLLAEIKTEAVYVKYLPYLEKEHQFWMDGKDLLQLSDSVIALKRIVKVEENKYLNRYWDSSTSPRPESYLQDIQLKEESGRDSTIFTDIRAAAESGWDFSSRWISKGTILTNIKTTQIIPVDLNCLLYNLEKSIAIAYLLKGNIRIAKDYNVKANTRKELILKYFWNDELNFYTDYNYVKASSTNRLTIAGMFPLFFELPENNNELNKIFDRLEKDFLKSGGLVTTIIDTEEQWDYPNGWAPLQWIGYKACKNYAKRYPKAEYLSKEIASRWTNLNIKIYFETGKMLEKYNVVNTDLPGGGGEYNLQDGFGWTNGVFLSLRKELKQNH